MRMFGTNGQDDVQLHKQIFLEKNCEFAQVFVIFRQGFRLHKMRSFIELHSPKI